MNLKISNICCIGAGYVGGPTMAVVAKNCPNLTIEVVDLSKKKINDWNNIDISKIPVFEPGLAEIIKEVRGKNLFFSDKIQESIEKADIIFISVNTPTKQKGVGAGKASDLKYIENCARTVARYSKGHTIVVEKSTIPVRTAEVIKKILESNNAIDNEDKKTFSILSNPEFLAEGSAINDLQNPDRILIGGEENEAKETLAKIYSQWVEPNKIIFTNLWSSELSKLTANAFLAQRISSINSISAVCEITGANIDEVAKAVGTDNRIGNKFLKTGPGFGGSCFKKDLLNLIYLCEHFGLEKVAEYWESVLKINDWQKERIRKLMVEKLFGSITNKKIAVLGFSFKANTNDTRESPSIEIVRSLLEEGANIYINDPKVSEKKITQDLYFEFIKEVDDLNKYFINEGSNYWTYSKDLEIVFKNCDAILILTEWEEYKKIDWGKTYKLMRKPAWVFDTRGVINQEDISKTNFNTWIVGKSILEN